MHFKTDAWTIKEVAPLTPFFGRTQRSPRAVADDRATALQDAWGARDRGPPLSLNWQGDERRSPLAGHRVAADRPLFGAVPWMAIRSVATH